MNKKEIDRLRQATNFPDLVQYLGDELDWPIEEEDADDLVFDYEPQELGIDPKHAVKIQSIKQIRPLVDNQPWGIFFIEFESKRLPVVVLRRILRALVPARRNRQAEQPVWQMRDLLFISAFGEEAANQREIAFAHFHQEGDDLPTLRVLGWDGSDTPLKLENVATTLQQKLHWPEDPDNQDVWREEWSQAFRHHPRHVIRTADALAKELAGLARRIRDAALLLIAHETESGPLRTLHKAFQTALIQDLSEADFADTYAQTITYGLLTAAISRTEMSEGQFGTALIADNVADIVPVTNPFLKEMLQSFLSAGGRDGGIDFDELGIQDVVELLRGDETDLPAILRDFGNKSQGEDPVIHFYEHFLAAYDKELKVQRGVFYTPKPVVSYIVRSVHELLQTEFGLEDGLADTTTWGEIAQRLPDLTFPEWVDPENPFVVILDPASGTATFLVEVIEVIHQTMTAKWRRSGLNAAQQQDEWNNYVPQYLLPRLYGYELMMAPYAIAHMKMGLKLYETGYRFRSKERVRIYLTDAMEQPDDQLALEGILPALAHESQAVNTVKQQHCFTAVIGNPPYSGESANKGDWIRKLVHSYMFVDGEHLGEKGKKNWLQDDYVKFIRFAQWRVEQSGCGILAFITNHGYMDNPTFRGMRQSLMSTFDQISVLNLHGNTKKKEEAPDSSRDENVFDIQQGVAVTICVKNSSSSALATVVHEDIWGLREHKYGYLDRYDVTSSDWIELDPGSPFYFFIPQDVGKREEFSAYWKITDAMPHWGAGIITAKDHFAVDFQDEPLRKRLELFQDATVSDQWIRDNLRIKDNSMWSMTKAREHFRQATIDERLFVDILYRVFDSRRTFYHTDIVFNMRKQIMRHMLDGNNLGLITARGIEVERPYDQVFCTRDIIQLHTLSIKEVNTMIPLYIYPRDTGLLNSLSWKLSEFGRYPNISRVFVNDAESRLDLTFISEGRGDLAETFGPEDVFHYAYAVFHSPAYRSRYYEYLKSDYPRLPLTSDIAVLRKLCALGADLVAVHLLDNEYVASSWNQKGTESPLLRPSVKLIEGTNGLTVGAMSINKAYDTISLRVFTDTSAIKTCTYFEGVTADVWEFLIGGYQVCHKWLYDRRAVGKIPGRTLTDEDIRHYQNILIALKETIRIMAEIDEAIEKHGGWPLK